LTDSRIQGLHKLDVVARIGLLEDGGWLSTSAAARLRAGRHVLTPMAADRMIENVIGVFGLPFAIAPNFRVNGKDCLVPLVVEEPSIVAGLSGAARRARRAGGFEAEVRESLLAGQVHVTDIEDPAVAVRALTAAAPKLLVAANRVHPRLTRRGGGVREIDIRNLELDDGSPLVAVHLLVDTCDAMGANLVNTICEALAPDIARLSGGRVGLAILSNLSDRSVAKARVCYPLSTLAGGGFEGAAVRDGIVLASRIAAVDPWRATTHNKGIMNGIDALAIATGNDWRAIEAGAHAYAAIGGAYRPLTRWRASAEGELEGEITIPLKVGTVGGTVAANPAAAMGLAITGAVSASELAGLMAAVGLAQNFAALRALVTSGIQAGHMKLHARSVAAAAGTPDTLFDAVVDELVSSGEIKAWNARKILERHLGETRVASQPVGRAAGKVILFGEHAVVYGRHALALPIPDAVRVSIDEADRLSVDVPEWGIDREIEPDSRDGIDAAIALILDALEIAQTGFRVHITTRLPQAMGLGSSAAIAVAVARAFNTHLGIGRDDAGINEIAFDCERMAHGTPSGIDNTLATYGEPMLFSRNDGLQTERIELGEPPPLVIACSSQGGLTGEQVAAVRARRAESPAHFDALFDAMDRLSTEGASLLVEGDYAALGRRMNIAHGLLNAIGVSTPELEQMVAIAREAGAAGAKLTGAGGGGSIVALCPGCVDKVRSALQDAGYRTLAIEPGDQD